MNLLLWQLADSSFPAGGFAHSSGLEAAMHHGHANDGSSVESFARHAVLQAGRGGLPLVTAAHCEPDRLADLDRLSHVFLGNPVAQRASSSQGRALLISAIRVFPQAPLAPIEADVRRENLAAHHAPVFGAVMRALHVELADAQRLFLYLAGRSVGTAAVRLGLLGAYEAQAVQGRLASHIEQTLDRCADLDAIDIAQVAPLNELFQATQDRLYSRLFQS